MVGSLADPIRRCWVEPPLEDSPIDNQGSGHGALFMPLRFCPSVDQQRTASLFLGRLPRLHAAEPATGPRKDVVNGARHGLTASMNGVWSRCPGEPWRADKL